MTRSAVVPRPRVRRIVTLIKGSELSGALGKAFEECLDAALARSAWPKSITRARLVQYRRHQFLPPARGNDQVLWVARSGDRVEGAAVLEPLPWDSDLYGFRMARLMAVFRDGEPATQQRVASSFLTEILRVCRQQAIDHVAVRVGHGDSGLAHALEDAGFRFIDTTVTLTRDTGGSERRQRRAEIRLATPDDIPPLERIASEALVDGRMYHDPWLPKHKHRQLYRRWIANACRGRSDAVFVYLVNRQPVGFVCCNVEREALQWLHTTVGYIDLLAVAPPMQGQGIGRALLRAGVAWLSTRANLVEIRTQVANGVSVSLYQQEGFRILSPGIALPSGHAFHGWFRGSR